MSVGALARRARHGLRVKVGDRARAGGLVGCGCGEGARTPSQGALLFPCQAFVVAAPRAHRPRGAARASDKIARATGPGAAVFMSREAMPSRADVG